MKIKAWLPSLAVAAHKFRDTEAEAKASVYEGGSIAPMIYSNSLRATTEQRIRELRIWIQEISN